jgi:sirohydrochlorin ferrochelatase
METVKTGNLLIFLLLLFFCLSFFTLSSSAEKGNKMGVVVISHGAPVETWNDTVIKLVLSVKSPYPLEPAFLDYDEERTLDKAVKRLEAKGVSEVLIVHLAPSSYSNHHEELFYLTGFRKDLGIYTEVAGKPIQSTIPTFAISPCMDSHPLIVEVLRGYAKELSENPSAESLILLAHGPVEEVENIMWVRQLKRIGEEIRKTLPFKEVVCMTLRNDSADLIHDQAQDDLRETAQRLSTQGKVLVVTYALGEGMLQEEVKHILKGIPAVVSQRGIISHPNAGKWIDATIQNGMNQPKVPPINRRWSRMDYEKGKPFGTHRYGCL